MHIHAPASVFCLLYESVWEYVTDEKKCLGKLICATQKYSIQNLDAINVFIEKYFHVSKSSSLPHSYHPLYWQTTLQTIFFQGYF